MIRINLWGFVKPLPPVKLFFAFHSWDWIVPGLFLGEVQDLDFINTKTAPDN